MSAHDLANLYAEDSYGDVEEVFDVQGDPVVVIDSDIAEALKGLTQEKRDIVLLSYFIGMTDYQIAKRAGNSRTMTHEQHNDTPVQSQPER